MALGSSSWLNFGIFGRCHFSNVKFSNVVRMLANVHHFRKQSVYLENPANLNNVQVEKVYSCSDRTGPKQLNSSFASFDINVCANLDVARLTHI